MDLTFSALAALGGVGLVAGFVDSIAGGGGLITVPALLLAGLDPVSALATNKLQSSFGSGSAVAAFARARLIDFRSARWMVLFTFAGAALGAAAVKIAPVALLSAALPLLLIAMGLYFALSPKLSDADAQARIAPLTFAATIGFGVGFYDGIFGPGTGSFFMLGFVLLLGYGVVRATAHTKLLNFTSNLAALLLFVIAGKVVWSLGIAMGLGQFVGAQLGSRLAMAKGAAIIRPLLVLMCLAMAIRLLLDPANPIHAALAAFAR